MIKNLVKKIRETITDQNRDFQERIFLIYALFSEVTTIIALVFDLIIKEYIGEIIVLCAVIVAVPLVSFICMYKNRIKFAIYFLLACLVFLIVPSLFFLGAGLEGGGVIWFIFAFMYIGLVITGRARIIFLGILMAQTVACYVIAYLRPEWVPVHSREALFIDSIVSIMLVGGHCFAMTLAQNTLLKAEKERAQKEAERAEELTRSQNRFFSSMSHEIRTPINSILGLNELILRDQSASKEIVKDATGIQGAGKMLLALINDILDFSKMEAGSMDIVPVDYNVGDMLSEIVNMIWLKAYEKGLKFDVTVDPKVPKVLYGDEVRIKQVIINLLNNAVKYTSEGSVDLHVESEYEDSTTALLTISISDTGMGIKKEALPYLFDAFKRVDEEKNRHIEGTGLGLSIVKQLVELMGGTVTVNSVYGEGSTFVVTLRQVVTDPAQIGDLNIHSQASAKRVQYETGFTAPEANILIVDDNDMNLEVETKLLADTLIKVDTAYSGKEALERSVKKHYDVILMDHLMPVMDGIECLERLRNQTGGLNRTTPVIVLTANAGSDNRNLYNMAGFDGYLVKPVSGQSLEDTLMKFIPKEKLIITGGISQMGEDINTSAGYVRKASVVITSTSVCDLPEDVIKKINVPILPFLVRTSEGVFKDGVQMDANELIRYINNGGNAKSLPPDVKAYTEFFANALKRAHHLIHISLTTSMSKDYQIASEAAKSFDNVTVVNSECLSSATGLLVLIAHRLAQQGIPAEEIVEELESVKKRLRCSFIIDTTEFMARRGLLGSTIHRLARSLNMRPVIKFKNDRASIGSIWMGNTKSAYKNYISKVIPVDIIPDSEVAFVTYADVPVETLTWVKEELSKTAYFEHVIFKQASAAISSNCGPGTIGILYFVKSNKSYNISSFITDESEIPVYEDAKEKKAEEMMAAEISGSEDAGRENASDRESEWFERIEEIDAKIAIENSGSREAFKTVLKIFNKSVVNKYTELQGYYNSGDWENYTIKIHALKSSAKLIGAMEIAQKAQLLENAGKEGNIGYIKENYESFMKEFDALGKKISEGFAKESGEMKELSAGNSKPVADDCLIKSVYEDFHEAAEAMDCDTIEGIFKEIDGYTIPAPHAEKLEKIRQYSEVFDYEAIIELLNEE